VTFAELISGGLHLVSLAGKDAVMATVARDGTVQPTELFKQVLAAAVEIKPATIGIASSANIFAGNENDRSQVQQFINLLTRVAIVADCSVVLISHPSVAGLNNESGLSGSTGWHSAVRARMWLRGVKAQDGEQPDSDLREIIFKKNQYGPLAENIALKFQNGLFLPVPGMSTIDRAVREARAEELFLALLRKGIERGENISPKRTANMFAPKIFSDAPEARTAGMLRKDFEAAMDRMFEANRIHVVHYGSDSRKAAKIMPGGK
jgi:RecA-family ATPase